MKQCTLLVNLIVLVGDSRNDLNGNLEMWKKTLEIHGFHISRTKDNIIKDNYISHNTKYMECKFSKMQINSTIKVKIDGHILSQVTRFRYLG
ncbi:hypothetical protein Lal_00041470 [Lupinus albus]|nr:hypothetical protein Lal_00041470 [Lupinus albus]